MTINKRNWQDINEIFDVMEDEDIPRACFYHLVYAGRGSELMKEDLDHEETRKAVRLIMDRTKAMFDKGLTPEVLTVDNHADGPFVYMEMLKEDPERAEEVLQLLQWNEGNSTGNGIGCVSWNGEVYADQFWRHFSFGNVRQRPFSEIWTDVSGDTEAVRADEAPQGQEPYVKGRCAECKWLQICGGNFRVRAEAATGDLWNAGSRPATSPTRRSAWPSGRHGRPGRGRDRGRDRRSPSAARSRSAAARPQPSDRRSGVPNGAPLLAYGRGSGRRWGPARRHGARGTRRGCQAALRGERGSRVGTHGGSGARSVRWALPSARIEARKGGRGECDV